MSKPRGKAAAPQARYLQVADILREEIATGVWPVGQALPTEAVLCERFDISRYTVREALRQLMELGLVSRRQGAGSFVRAIEPPAGFRQTLGALQDLLQYAQDTQFSLGPAQLLKADAELAALLGVDKGSEWFYLEGLRTSSRYGRPLSLTHVYLPAAYGAVLPLPAELNRPIYSIIEQHFGVDIARVDQDIQAVPLDEDSAKALMVRPGVAGLRTLRRYYLADDSLMLASLNLHPGDLFTYTMRIKRDS